MALSDFNENDYTQRQSGLQEWLNGAGNATPGVSAYPGQVPIAPVTTQPDLSAVEPNAKAAALAQESFAPGTQNAIPVSQPSAAAPSTPFANTTAGAVLGAMMPHTFGAANTLSRGKALTDYIQSIPSDNDPTIAAIQGMAKQDPANGEKYAGAISQYMAQNQTPIARTQAEEEQMKLGAAKFDLNIKLGGMRQAAADAPGGQAPAVAAPAPAQRSKVLGPPAEWLNQKIPAQGPTATGQPLSALQAYDKYPAQTTAESGGNPNAVSPKGALGAKQIMPATGKDPGYGVKPWDGTQEDNIRFGNDYYDAMLKNYKQNVPVALAAYNWGPGNVDKWLKAGGDPAQIPKETMDYVTKLAPQMQAALPADSTKVASNAPMSAQEQHIELLRQQAAQGLIPYSDYISAKDPTNPANIPSHKMEGDTLFSQKPGEEPTPYAVPPMNGSNFKTGSGGVILPSKSFGFVTQPHTTATLKIAQDQDKLMQQGDQNNNNVIKDMQRQLDVLQDTLPHLNTGVGFGPLNQFTAGINGMMPAKTAGMKDQADSYSKAEMAGKTLALDAQGLNKTAGSGGGRAGKLALSVTIDSKPGVDKTPAANISQINDIRSNLADLETSRDLYQKYREMSPYGITDDNTRQLDDALKTIYPTSTKDASGNVVFNQHNADMIRGIIPHAIANPTPFLKQASMMNQTETPSYDPNKAGTTAAAPQAMNFDAQGNLLK